MRKKIIKKKFYSFHDSAVYEFLTPKFQHQIISLKSEEKKGKILFYTSEDPVYNKKGRVIREKLKEKPNVDGFILIHLQQLSYSGTLDLNLIKEILKEKYELHFCKEDLSLHNLSDFKKNLDNFITYNSSKKLVNLKDYDSKK